MITTILDKLPFLETKTPSSLTVIGEFAQLIPGHSRAIEKEGNAYIDDFEGSETSIDLKQFSSWKLSSTPRGFFPEAATRATSPERPVNQNSTHIGLSESSWLS